MAREAKHVAVESLTTMTPTERKDALFSGKVRIIGSLSLWKKDHPAEYNEARAIAQGEGKIGENWSQTAASIRQGWREAETLRSYSQAELISRAKWPESVLRRVMDSDYMGTPLQGVGLGEFAKNSPTAYAELVLAQASYGLSGRSVQEAERRLLDVSRIPEPVTIQNRHQLEAKLQDKFALPGEVDDATLNAAAAAAEQLANEEAFKAVHNKAAEIIKNGEQA